MKQLAPGQGGRSRAGRGAVVLAGGLVAGLAVLGGGSDADVGARSPRRGLDADAVAAASTPARARGRRPTRRWRRSTPRRSTGRPARGGDQCATLTVPVDYAEPDGAHDRPRAAEGAARTRRTARLAGGQPGRPRRPGTSVRRRRARWSSAPDVLAKPRHRRLRPPRHRRLATRSTASRPRSSTRPGPGPRPRHRRRGRGVRRRSQETSAPAAWRAVRRPARPRHHRSRPPATWTCCGPRWARRKLDYFGASYGTKLGATYAELFPDSVGRFVLDGAVDLVAVHARAQPGQAAGLRDRAAGLRGRLRRHGADASSATPPRPAWQRISGLLASIDADPLPTGGDRELTAGHWPSTASSRRSTTATTGRCSTRR